MDAATIVDNDEESSDGDEDIMIDENRDDDTSDDDHEVTVSFQGFTQSRRDDYPANAILIDSGSTRSVFKSKSLLQNVRKNNATLRAYTNAGYQDSTLVGDLPGFFHFWRNDQSMLNILALCDVRTHFRVTMDSDTEAAFIVHASEDKKLKFNEVDSGLYLLDEKPNNTLVNKVNAYSYLTLVNKNKTRFTRRELEGIENAKALHKYLGMPGYNKFREVIQNNLILNNPVTL